MLPQWSRLDTKVDDLLALLVSLQQERQGLHSELAAARRTIDRYESERLALSERIGRLLSELEQLEEASRG